MLRKCLFPVAGYGTRFLPATKVMPKEMLPILDKPLVQYGIEEAAEAGLNQICFVTGQAKRAIEDHFDRNMELDDHLAGTERANTLLSLNELITGCQFTYTRQAEQLGLGHAIKVGESLIGNEPFGVVLPDDFCIGNDVGVMSQLKSIFQEHQCTVIAVEEVPMDRTASYGIIRGHQISSSLYEVEKLVEKPAPESAPSNIAVIGRYILSPEVFGELATINKGVGGEYQLTDAISNLAQNSRVLALKFDGCRFDCGSLAGFVAATNYSFRCRFGTAPP